MGLSISLILFTCCRFCHSYPFNLTFINGSDTLSNSNREMAIGYDRTTNDILLLGGRTYKQELTLFKYKSHHFFDGDQYFLDHAIYGYSQYYTQLNNDLWIIRPAGGFIKFNTETHGITLPTITIPNNATQSCLTSTQDHIIVIGSKLHPQSVHIYDINDDAWLSAVPSLISPRESISCVVVNNNVYAIGGQQDYRNQYNTIEILNISNIDSISSKTWQYMKSALTFARDGTRAVVHGTDIYVVGGYYYDDAYYYVSDINVIDTLTEECVSAGALNFPERFAAVIIIENVLYVFGGQPRSEWPPYDDRYQYALLSTPEPMLTSLSSDQEMQNMKTNTIVIIVVSVCLCCLLLFGVFYVGKREFDAQKVERSVTRQITLTPLHPPGTTPQLGPVMPSNISTFNRNDHIIEETVGKVANLNADEFIVRADTDNDDDMSPVVALCNTTKVIGEREGYDDQKSTNEKNRNDYIANKDGAKEVKTWLGSVGGSIYYNRFIQNGFDSMDLIKEINDVNDLKRIGIPLKAQQLKIMKQIEQLKQ